MTGKRKGKRERRSTMTTQTHDAHRRQKDVSSDRPYGQRYKCNRRHISKATCRNQPEITREETDEVNCLKSLQHKNKHFGKKKKTMKTKTNNLFQHNKSIHFLKRPLSDTIFPIQPMSTSSSYVSGPQGKT